MEKSLMRMLSAKGNPQANKPYQIVEALQRRNGLKPEVGAG